MKQDGQISLIYDISQDDKTLASSLEEYTLAYSLHAPEELNAELPCFIFCHPFNNSREYWQPQISDSQLSSHPKIVLDSLGFGLSSTQGRPWTFDLAAYSIHCLLDELAKNAPEGWPRDAKYVVVGDSMGGGPTGLRVALQDAKRVKDGKKKRIFGVAACGTAAEEESEDFVQQYTEGAEEFASKCLDPKLGPTIAIRDLAANMSSDGYTPSSSEPYASSRSFGAGVIERGLTLGLRNKEGNLDPTDAGDALRTNFHCLNYRKSLIPKLAVRPSPLLCQVLVVHGTAEKAYPFERKYHERTQSAIGDNNAEIYVVEGGPHFVTVTHAEEVDKKILEWYERKCK